MHLTGKRNTTSKFFDSDDEFNQLYPVDIQKLAQRYWTPLYIAKRAANFLASENNPRILDIGSGVGKFCLAAANYIPGAYYYGIEQRKALIDDAEKARTILHLDNVSFIHGNFTQIDFKNYDSFYFYNSFYENLAGTEKIDDSIEYSAQLYNYYNRYLFRQLELKPTGTRLATYYWMEDEIPKGYHLIETDMNNLLKFWIKIDMKK